MNKIFFLVLLFPALMLGQNAQDIIDGLKTDLKSKPNAQKTASIYSDLTWYYANVSIDSALYYGGKAVQESKKLGDSTLLAQVYSDVGAVYLRKGDLENSKENYLKAYAIRKIRKDSKGLAKINNNLANVYLNKQQFPLAMKSFLEALKYFESVNDEANIAVTNGNIGSLFLKLKNYPNAIKYLKPSIAFAEKNKMPDRLCEFYLNIGNAYKEMNDTIRGVSFYNKSIKNCQLVGNNKALAICYQNAGLLKSKNSKVDESKAFFDKSKQLNAKVNSNNDLANLNISISRNLIKEKKYKEAKKMLLDGLKVFDSNDAKNDQLISYKLLVSVYAYLNVPDSATFYNEKYALLNEKMIQTTTLKLTSEMEAKYQTAQKEKLLLKKEAEAKEQQNLLFAISGLAFFIALIGFLIYRQQKLKNRQQEQEYQLKSAIAQIETQNQLQEQRLTISRDLHDNIGAQLTFIISSVDNIKYAFDIQNVKLDSKLQSISNFTKSTIVELRDTIWAMNSNEITFEDLRARILNFLEKAKTATENIDFQFEIDEDLNELQLTSIFGMNIYRTLQEAINNALKYANPTQMMIQVKKIDNTISIEIHDNGDGFDLENVIKGNGLLNMEKRIESIGGIYKLQSEVGKGTSVSILIHL
ncbi:tetratricopeptide repeat protein [Flavobacterium sp.]|uniref:tetratricopeptide repeat-containing sensor histidine kinase n=1 Tax=Flavobacterium sp. TaxID=239 RepID=UPI00286BD418|nr:tetratricopeptide repeat protein [Flavobacterium sp.]